MSFQFPGAVISSYFDLGGVPGDGHRVRRRITLEPVPETVPETQPESVPSSVPSSIPPPIPRSYQTRTQTELDDEDADVGTEGTIGPMDGRDNWAESHPNVTWMETQTSETDIDKVPHLIQIVD